jgi:hypothetical protein
MFRYLRERLGTRLPCTALETDSKALKRRILSRRGKAGAGLDESHRGQGVARMALTIIQLEGRKVRPRGTIGYN